MSGVLRFILAILAVLYVGGTAALFVFQRALIYPGRGSAPVAISALPGFASVELHTADQLTLRAAYRAGRSGKATVVFLHGNGDNLLGAEAATRGLAAAGYNILLVEYRGYGGNPGTPDEDGLYADGRAALQWVREHDVPPERTIVIGHSLGSGTAVQLAVEQPLGGLVLVSGFTSLPDVAALHLPYVPARLLVRDRFDNLQKIARVRAPVLVVHGKEDTLVPVAQGQMNAAAAPRSTLVIVDHVGHELAYLPASQNTIVAWIGKIAPERPT